MSNRILIFLAFGGVWTILMSANIAFHKYAAAATKRRFYVLFDFMLSILFACFMTYWVQNIDWVVVALIWGMSMGVAILNWKNIWFCHKCNATVWPSGFSPKSVCSKCSSQK